MRGYFGYPLYEEAVEGFGHCRFGLWVLFEYEVDVGCEVFVFSVPDELLEVFGGYFGGHCL
jgi:hypothetical protein